MSILDNLETTDHSVAPVIAIYGTGGIGKTSLASEFPSPLYLFTEGEKPPVDINLSGKKIKTIDDIYAFVGALLNDQHEYKTLIVDSLDAVEPMIWAATCARMGWDSVDSNDKGSPTAFGKGWPEVDKDWLEFLEAMHALSAAGIGVVLLAHDDSRKVKGDPLMDEYHRYEPDLNRRAADLIKNGVEALLFMSRRVSIKQVEGAFGAKPTQKPDGESGAERMIYTDERAGFLAKNRLNMPSKIVYKKGNGYAELSKYFGERS